MTRRWILILIGAALLVPLALAFTHPKWVVSSGALSPQHAELASNCFACHVPFRGAPSERCIACHAVAKIGLRSTKGVPIPKPAGKAAFHQALVEQDCVTCHSGHVSSQLAPSGIKTFAHTLLRPEMRDRCETCHTAPKNEIHRGIAVGCKQCHKPDGWKPAAFDHKLLTKSVLERCETCHKAPNDTRHGNIKGNCALCHTPERWEPATFNHAKHFVLDGDHDVACATCHAGDDYRRYTCYGCHEHNPEEIRRKHLEEGIRDFENCVRCHRSADEEPGEERERD